MRIGRARQAEALANGILYQTEFPAWNEIAAAHRDGAYYVLPGWKWSPEFLDPCRALLERGFPPLDGAAVNTVTMEELFAFYDEAAQRGTTVSGAVDSAQAKLAKILADAASARASDLKVIENDGRARIRIKVAGREFTGSLALTAAEGKSVISSVFDARDEGTGDSTAITGRFQSFSVSPGTQRLRLPAGVIKMRGQRGFHEQAAGLGDHMVLRLFYSDAAQRETATLEALGFDAEVQTALERARAKLAGGVIIAGATGDGKSTTLVRCLQTLYEEHLRNISIVTIEDPVEYRINGDGIIQIPVRSAGDAAERTAAFRQALMHFVRINPDVGAISEIRDAEAAKEALQFIDTGHQVWTTIHGSTANGILFRLIEMGIPPEELCKPGSIELLMKQSLAPILCDCARPAADAKTHKERHVGEQISRLDADPERIRLRNVEGCPECRPATDDAVAVAAWTGYRRQTAVAEIIIPDAAYFEAVRRRDSFAALNHWLTPAASGGLGGTSLDVKLTRLVLDGRLDPCDAVRKGVDIQKVDIERLHDRPPGIARLRSVAAS